MLRVLMDGSVALCQWIAISWFTNTIKRDEVKEIKLYTYNDGKRGEEYYLKQQNNK